MFNKPRCEKAQSIPRKLPLYCEGKFLCAHQYHCPQTRQYENTADYSKCTRLPQKEEAKPQTDPVKFVVNVVPKEEQPFNCGPVCGTKPLDIKDEDVVYSGTLKTSTMTCTLTVPDDETSSEAIPTPIYTKNVSPIDYGVKKEIETPAVPEGKPNEKDTVTNTQVRKETKNGTVRNTRRRKPKKG